MADSYRTTRFNFARHPYGRQPMTARTTRTLEPVTNVEGITWMEQVIREERVELIPWHMMCTAHEDRVREVAQAVMYCYMFGTADELIEFLDPHDGEMGEQDKLDDESQSDVARLMLRGKERVKGVARDIRFIPRNVLGLAVVMQDSLCNTRGSHRTYALQTLLKRVNALRKSLAPNGCILVELDMLDIADFAQMVANECASMPGLADDECCFPLKVDQQLMLIIGDKNYGKESYSEWRAVYVTERERANRGFTFAIVEPYDPKLRVRPHDLSIARRYVTSVVKRNKSNKYSYYAARGKHFVNLSPDVSSLEASLGRSASSGARTVLTRSHEQQKDFALAYVTLTGKSVLNVPASEPQGEASESVVCVGDVPDFAWETVLTDFLPEYGHPVLLWAPRSGSAIRACMTLRSPAWIVPAYGQVMDHILPPLDDAVELLLPRPMEQPQGTSMLIMKAVEFGMLRVPVVGREEDSEMGRIDVAALDWLHVELALAELSSSGRLSPEQVQEQYINRWLKFVREEWGLVIRNSKYTLLCERFGRGQRDEGPSQTGRGVVVIPNPGGVGHHVVQTERRTMKGLWVRELGSSDASHARRGLEADTKWSYFGWAVPIFGLNYSSQTAQVIGLRHVLHRNARDSNVLSRVLKRDQVSVDRALAPPLLWYAHNSDRNTTLVEPHTPRVYTGLLQTTAPILEYPISWLVVGSRFAPCSWINSAYGMVGTVKATGEPIEANAILEMSSDSCMRRASTYTLIELLVDLPGPVVRLTRFVHANEEILLNYM